MRGSVGMLAMEKGLMSYTSKHRSLGTMASVTLNLSAVELWF